MNSKAIAIMSFGTTYLDTTIKTIDAVISDVENHFSDYIVDYAYTSNVVRERLLRKGIRVQSPTECLDRLVAQGVKDVIVLPTHLLAGREYSKVLECVKTFESKFNSIKVCRPMVEEKDVWHIVDIIMEVFKMPEDTFLMFMGHGSQTDANEIYHDINNRFKYFDSSMFVATVESTPSLRNAQNYVSWFPQKKILLTPFMLVSGEHAYQDMILKWKPAFEKDGYEVECLVKGLGEYPQFRQVYIDRLKEVLC